MWSTNPKAITSTSHQVKENVEDGLEMEKDYIVTVTVLTEYGNVSSSSNFSEAMSLHSHCMFLRGIFFV